MTINNTKVNNLPTGNSNPDMFGPFFWGVLHTYSSKNKYTKEWLDTFRSKIPCPECKSHFATFPDPVNENFFMWTVKAHNKVNEKLRKKHMDYVVAKSFYDNN